MPETPSVEAFIVENQRAVLVRGIDSLSRTSRSQLREQVHRLMGTFGTYQIHDAVAAISPLHELLSTKMPPEGEVEQARVTALQLLDRARQQRESQP